MGTHLEREIVYPAWERPGFLVIITLIGGYMNAYTYITRDGVLANMHTANMSHLGINLALGNWQIALTYFLPIASCIFGAAFSEAVKVSFPKVPFMEIGVNLPCFWKPRPSLLWAVCHCLFPIHS